MSAPPEEADLLTRLRRIGEDPSGAGATDPATAREAGRLLRSQYRDHGTVRPPEAHALGLYYWRRSLVLSGWFRQPARRMAADLLTSVFLAGAEPFPADAIPVVLPEARRRAERALHAALRSRDADQFSQAAAYWRRIAAATPGGDPQTVDVAEGLSVSLTNLFDYTDDPAELDDVITFNRSVLAHLPTGVPAGPVRFLLAGAIGVRCDRFGSADFLGDLGEAIALMRTELTTCTERNRVAVLMLLSAAYMSRAEFTEAPEDADEAVRLARQAVGLAGQRHPLQRVLNTGLAMTLLARYELSADPHDLAEALKLGTDAGTPAAGKPVLAETSQRIAAAAALAQNASADAGSLDNLDQAIDLLRTATSELPDASPGKPMLLRLLIGMLQDRRIVTGSSADLDAAIDVAQLAVALEDVASPRNRAKALMMLCGLFGARYEDAGDPADIAAAVAASQEAAGLVPVDALPAAFAYYRALVLMQQYGVRGEAADLEEALQVMRQLVASPATPARIRVIAMMGLAGALRNPADPTWADMDEAIRLLRQVMAAPESDAYQKALAEYKLAAALAQRFGQRAARRDADESLALLARNLQTTQLAASRRIEAAVTAAELERDVGEPGWLHRAAGQLAAAVRLLPFAAARTLSRTDRQRALGEWSGLAARAAALALADERPGEPPEQRAVRALGLLEAGRTVLLNQAYDTRGDLDGVWRADPALARRFLDLREQLDHDPPGGAGELRTMSAAAGSSTAAHLLALESGAGDQRRAGLAFAEVVEKIRMLPGQSGFMRAPDLRELTAQAAHGPIIVLNVTEMRGDAFLVTPAGVRALPLPALTADTAADAADCLHQSTQEADTEGILQVLGWLWDTIAGPVLAELGLDRAPTPPEPWPRIWWVAGGVLANMPLHAASRYPGGQGTDHRGGGGDRPPDSVLDRVISSYAPNVRTLRYLRERSARYAAQPESGRGSLVVAMCQTPGTQLRDLPNAGPEADFVAGVLPGPVLLAHEMPPGGEPAGPPVTDPAGQPTTGQVLAELARSRIAHFACHAEADTTDPSRSGLRLLDEPLTVSALGAQDLDSVEFAFLSACSTALNRARDLLDESIHVVSALQLAGIPQVVGTFWEVEDFASLAVVKSFYTKLGARNLDTSAAAETLHEITRLVRDEVSDAPWIWAAHMYAGC